MKIKGLISEDFVNYKKSAMTIMFPYCTFKCGTEYCQNSPLSKAEDIEMDITDIVIYTGYYKEEIADKIALLSKYKNIIIKYGRYIPNQEKHYDEVLGVYLASSNQRGEKIS